MHLVAILLDGLINSVMTDEHSFVVVLLDRFMSSTMSHEHGSISVPIKVCSIKERNHFFYYSFVGAVSKNRLLVLELASIIYRFWKVWVSRRYYWVVSYTVNLFLLVQYQFYFTPMSTNITPRLLHFTPRVVLWSKMFSTQSLEKR